MTITTITPEMEKAIEEKITSFLGILLREQDHDDYDYAVRVLTWEIVARKAHTYAARFA
jgi:hypothetical protein